MDGASVSDELNGGLGRTNRMRSEEKLAGKLGNKLSEKPGDKWSGSTAEETKNQPADQSNTDQLTNDNLRSNLNGGVRNSEPKDEPRRAPNVRLFNDASHKHSPPNEFYSRSLKAPSEVVDRFSDQFADRANENDEPIKTLLLSKWSVIKEFLFPPRPEKKGTRQKCDLPLTD